MLESLPFLVLMLGTHRGSTLLIGAVSTPFGCLGDTLHESLRQQVLHDWRHQQSRFETGMMAFQAKRLIGFWLSAHLQFASHCWHKLSVAFAGLSSLSWCVLSIYSL
jgi:hypothetical protein